MWALEMALSPASISPQRIDEKQQLTATKGVTGAITILRAQKLSKGELMTRIFCLVCRMTNQALRVMCYNKIIQTFFSIGGQGQVRNVVPPMMRVLNRWL